MESTRAYRVPKSYCKQCPKSSTDEYLQQVLFSYLNELLVKIVEVHVGYKIDGMLILLCPLSRGPVSHVV